MVDSEEDCRKTKRPRVEKAKCAICEEECYVDELVKLKDIASWQRLYEIAKIRHIEPILRIADANPPSAPDIRYHKKCRDRLTHVKNLRKIQGDLGNLSSEPSSVQRRSSRQSTDAADKSRVYPEVCIFCEKKTKYIQGSRTREPLIQSSELRADETVRDAAIRRCDERIIALTSRDIVAAEGHYHATCYRRYTVNSKRDQSTAPKTASQSAAGDDGYANAVGVALEKLYPYVRCNILFNPRLVSLVEITAKLESFFIEQDVEIRASTKKNLRRNLEAEFGDTLHFFETDHRVFLRPHNLKTDDIASEVIRLEKRIQLYNQGQDCVQLIENVAIILRDSIKGSIQEQMWPPHPEELDKSYIELPECLMTFLKVLLGGTQRDASDRISRLSWSFAQDILNAVTNAQVVTPKHVLLA